MGWREGGEAPRRLLELTGTADLVAPPRLVPRDGDVDETLVETPLGRSSRTPRELELLVRGEVLTAADQVEPALERVRGRP